MNKYKVRLSNGKETYVKSKNFIECYNNALKGEENDVEVVSIELAPNIFTEVENIILENTDDKYEYIARDKCGNLSIYTDKPIKQPNEWFHEDWHDFQAFQHLFQNIKWEDNKPYKFR